MFEAKSVWWNAGVWREVSQQEPPEEEEDPWEETDAQGHHLCECNKPQLIWYSSEQRVELMLLLLVYEQLHFLGVCSYGSMQDKEKNDFRR